MPGENAGSSPADELAEHVGQYAAVQVVIDLDWSVNPQRHRRFHGPAAGPMDHQSKVLSRTYATRKSGQIICLAAVQAERLCVDSILELAGQDAHPHEIAAMYSFKAFGDHCPYAQQQRSFCSPIPRAAGPVLLTRYHHQWDTCFLVLYGRVVNAHYLAIVLMNGDAAFDARHHQILDPNVGKGAAHHYLVVA